MKKIMKMIPLMFLVLTTSCGGGYESDEASGSNAVDKDGMSVGEGGEEMTETATAAEEVNFESERKLIKNGILVFESDDVRKTRGEIYKISDKYNAYISSDAEYKSYNKLTYTIVMRIPPSNYNSVLNEIADGVEQFDSKEISIKDVTEEYIDVEARLKTKKEIERRFVALLEKAEEIPEIMEIEKEIADIRSEIESIEGRLNYLKNQVSYGTLTVEFYQRIPVVQKSDRHMGNKFTNGFKRGWQGIVWFFVALTHIWPLLLIGLIILFYFRYRRRLRKKK